MLHLARLSIATPTATLTLWAVRVLPALRRGGLTCRR